MSEKKWKQPKTPPPPLFTGKKERDLVKQVNDELIERVIGQQILYYAVDLDFTNFHPLYGEAMNKSFLPPVRVYALVNFEGYETTMDNYGADKNVSVTVHFHKRRLVEDQDLYVREGDFILYGEQYYQIVTLSEPRELFGQAGRRVEISAKCIKAREGLFDAS
jgi:hypothetical protein